MFSTCSIQQLCSLWCMLIETMQLSGPESSAPRKLELQRDHMVYIRMTKLEDNIKSKKFIHLTEEKT